MSFIAFLLFNAVWGLTLVTISALQNPMNKTLLGLGASVALASLILQMLRLFGGLT